MSFEGWKQYKLDEFCELKKESYFPNRIDDLNYIGLEHIDQQTLSLNGIGNSKEVTSNKFKFTEGDILFGKLRPYFRKVVKPKFSGVCSTDIMVLKAKENFDQEFLFYFLANQDFIDFSNAGSTGTRMPRADWSHLKDSKWHIPDLTIQKKIGSILSSLDDKIELNRQTNQTLEAIAQAIFKEWFVDFNFPGATGEMEDSELGKIPKGWRVGKLGDIILNYDSKRIPLSSREREKRKGIYPYYGAASIVDYVDDFLFEGVYLLMGEDGTVITADERPVLQYVSGKFWVNNHTHVLTGKDGISTEYVYLHLKNTNVKHIVTGAVQPKINQGNMNNLIIIIPDKSILRKFSDKIKPLFDLLVVNEEQVKILTQLRDSLLPKLMKGEIIIK
jgi:type I restriction enzyme S subunit